MNNTHINPFLSIQNNGKETVLYLTNKPENSICITDSEHPLYNVTNIESFFNMLPVISKEELALLQSEDIISNTPFDRADILLKSYAKQDSSQSYSITIMPTLDCNNSCVYCYQEHENQPVMNQQNYQILFKVIKNKLKNIKSFNINIMGGEPTLVADELLEFIGKVKTLCEEMNVKFSAAVTTNGRLLGKNNLADKFVKSGVKYFQITLDGPPETHNILRCGLNGEETFHETFAGILALRDLPFKDISCSIRINHTLDTALDAILVKFYKFLAKYFANDLRFEIYNHTAGDLGGDVSNVKLIPKSKRYKILQKIDNITVNNGLIIKTDVMRPNGRVCYAARKNSITIMPGNKLVKCTVALDEPFNQVGFLAEDGTIVLNKNFDLWIDHTCPSSETCNVAPICQGKCCPLKKITTGKNICPDVKFDKKFIFRQLQVQEMLSNYK